jgi:hypothetical protein
LAIVPGQAPLRVQQSTTPSSILPAHRWRGTALPADHPAARRVRVRHHLRRSPLRAGPRSHQEPPPGVPRPCTVVGAARGRTRGTRSACCESRRAVRAEDNSFPGTSNRIACPAAGLINSQFAKCLLAACAHGGTHCPQAGFRRMQAALVEAYQTANRKVVRLSLLCAVLLHASSAFTPAPSFLHPAALLVSEVPQGRIRVALAHLPAPARRTTNLQRWAFHRLGQVLVDASHSDPSTPPGPWR